MHLQVMNDVKLSPEVVAQLPADLETFAYQNGVDECTVGDNTVDMVKWTRETLGERPDTMVKEMKRPPRPAS